MSRPERPDMLGIGFGPSNLALAIALAERGVRGRFVDAQPRFGWHRDMLLPGTRMQIPFLKDLATLRNPQSAFTFVNYLNDRGRLVDFIGRHDVFPSRYEFHDYLQWAADQFAAEVRYGNLGQAEFDAVLRDAGYRWYEVSNWSRRWTVLSFLSLRMSRPLWMLSSTKASATFCAAAAGRTITSGAAARIANAKKARRIRGIENCMLWSFPFGQVSRFAMASSRQGKCSKNQKSGRSPPFCRPFRICSLRNCRYRFRNEE